MRKLDSILLLRLREIDGEGWKELKPEPETGKGGGGEGNSDGIPTDSSIGGGVVKI